MCIASEGESFLSDRGPSPAAKGSPFDAILSVLEGYAVDFDKIRLRDGVALAPETIIPWFPELCLSADVDHTNMYSLAAY
eukprot:tig00000093_g3600.t1